jgi:hypothetical protein
MFNVVVAVVAYKFAVPDVVIVPVARLVVALIVVALIAAAVVAPVTRNIPETSKLNVGVCVFTPTYPEPPAAYKEILSAVAAAVGSFSIPMVKRPVFVVAPEPSWYFMYA